MLRLYMTLNWEYKVIVISDIIIKNWDWPNTEMSFPHELKTHVFIKGQR